MAESEGNNKMERLCIYCGFANPPGAETCQPCEMLISFIPDTPVSEPFAKAADEQQTQGAASATEENTVGGKCPDCGAEGSYVNNRCSMCDDWSTVTSFSLKWQDDRISSVAISAGIPVFIGRVPPVDAELARQIETYYQTVSRIHAELYLDSNGSLYLRDMGSQNGTSINDCKIQKFEPQLLKAGDKTSFSSSLCAQVIQI